MRRCRIPCWSICSGCIIILLTIPTECARADIPPSLDLNQSTFDLIEDLKPPEYRQPKPHRSRQEELKLGRQLEDSKSQEHGERPNGREAEFTTDDSAPVTPQTFMENKNDGHQRSREAANEEMHPNAQDSEGTLHSSSGSSTPQGRQPSEIQQVPTAERNTSNTTKISFRKKPGVPDLFKEERANCSEAFTQQLLVIVGDVSERAARLLVEDLRASPISPIQMVVQSISSEDSERSLVLYKTELPMFFGRRFPQVISLLGLQHDTRYIVQLRPGTAEEIPAMFRTLPEPVDSLNNRTDSMYKKARGTKLSFPVVSCDRFNDDMDSSFWRYFIKRERNRTGMFHLGDQVYNDRVVQHILSSPKTYDSAQLRDLFRQGYRFSWGRDTAATMLRNGAHWMVPDDHDIVNNLDAWMVGHKDPARHLLTPFIQAVKRKLWALGVTEPNAEISPANTTDALMVKHYNTGMNKLSHVLHAGRQTAYEYQFQLISDMLNGSTVTVNVSHRKTSSHRQSAFSYSTAYAISPQTGRQHISEASWSRGEEVDTDQLDPWYFARTIGNVGILFVDMRWEQTFNGGKLVYLLSSRQLAFVNESLRLWELNSGVDHIIVLSAHPLIWMDETLSLFTEFVENDRYSTHPHNAPALRELLNLLFSSSKVDLTIGGDIHVFAHQEIERRGFASRSITQLASSGVTYNSSTIFRPMISLFDGLLTDFFGAKFETWTADFTDIWLGNTYVLFSNTGNKQPLAAHVSSLCGSDTSVEGFCQDGYPTFRVEGRPGYFEHANPSSLWNTVLKAIVPSSVVESRLNGSIRIGTVGNGPNLLSWEAVLRPLPHDPFSRLFHYLFDEYRVPLTGSVLLAIFSGLTMTLWCVHGVLTLCVVGVYACFSSRRGNAFSRQKVK
eukprot:gb/GECG01003660.1/.p1 GENE.gb/GECG01003660.1/~~gb/GECG01003660.1/.p1  ORF type:complete len:896 (+),score=72.49 gb/GECG01003660.1/:1-2688(+)